MAWTSPATLASTVFTTNHLVSAADMALILDDLTWLKERPMAHASMTGSPTTTSTTFVIVTGMTTTITTTGGKVWVRANLFSSNSGTQAHVFTVFINGSNVGDATFGLSVVTNTQANAVGNNSLSWVTPTAPTAGSVQCDIYWRVLGNTGSMFVGSMSAEEIG